MFTLYVHSLCANQLPALARGADRTMNPVSNVCTILTYAEDTGCDLVFSNHLEFCVEMIEFLTFQIVRHFFRTNKGTCQEWLLRVRMNLIILGLYGGNPAMAVHHAFTLLQDMVDGNSTHVSTIVLA